MFSLPWFHVIALAIASPGRRSHSRLDSEDMYAMSPESSRKRQERDLGVSPEVDVGDLDEANPDEGVRNRALELGAT